MTILGIKPWSTGSPPAPCILTVIQVSLMISGALLLLTERVRHYCIWVWSFPYKESLVTPQFTLRVNWNLVIIILLSAHIPHVAITQKVLQLSSWFLNMLYLTISRVAVYFLVFTWLVIFTICPYLVKSLNPHISESICLTLLKLKYVVYHDKAQLFSSLTKAVRVPH